MSTHEERVYLVVPFAEREQAHRMGAHWDESVGAWYVPASSDLQPVQAWLSGIQRVRKPDPLLNHKVSSRRTVGVAGIDRPDDRDPRR